ncbi:glycine--tRNA ligase [Eisenibacter elegans]|jgi:glycyl-tRNA synthetase|uniref:glycine--tRNA ligase n=1 Tax=Eisenibacter elegans TaxID=997 RepID=UPI0004044E4D|nr:glycine--tRNA ligase [Eisenibacter elegans]
MSKKTQEEHNPLKPIIAHAKEYGFVFPSSEIYEGLQAVYDYGQNGVALKNNLKQLWWAAMTQWHENVVGIDAAIFMHPTVWKASGHVDSFNDPMIDNRDSKKRYRADNLIEDKAAQYEKAGDTQKSAALLTQMAALLEAENFEGLRQLIIDEGIVCPISGTANWTEVRQFNLMFSTEMGSVADDSNRVYLRPETAQGIFVNFLNVQKTSRQQVPFGIAQIGKAFRNEIVARQFIFRMREFEQMEMQYFVKPGTELEAYEYWKEKRMRFLQAILPAEKLRFKIHEKLAHYANAAVDIEFEFPFGFKELEGIHSRTDFDLSSHQTFARTKLQYFDEQEPDKDKRHYVPYVVETSIGADRLFLAVLSNALTISQGVDAKGETKERIFLKLHPAIAPTKVAIFPLTRKDGLPEKAREVFDEFRYDLSTVYEDRGAIGKNYTRQDLVGTPFCLTIDHQTLEDGTITLRHRDSTEQERLSVAEAKAKILAATSFKTILAQL